MYPSLVRIDNKLIHGQVVTGWVKKNGVKRIIIVDDATKNDSFMKQIFDMAKPPGTTLEILSAEEAAQKWKDDKLGIKTSTLVLFKDVERAYTAFMNGFRYQELQIGCIGGGPGRINLVGPVCVSEAEAGMLTEMKSCGLDIYLQSTEHTKRVSWSSIQERFFSGTK